MQKRIAIVALALTAGSAQAGTIEGGTLNSSVSIDSTTGVLAGTATPSAFSSSLLSDAGSTTSSGGAYLLFAQSLNQPTYSRQASVGTQIASYVTNFGPINRVAEDGGGPTPVPLPAAAWLFLSGLVTLKGVRLKKATRA